MANLGANVRQCSSDAASLPQHKIAAPVGTCTGPIAASLHFDPFLLSWFVSICVLYSTEWSPPGHENPDENMGIRIDRDHGHQLGNLHQGAPGGKNTASARYTAASSEDAHVGIAPDVLYATSETEGCAAFIKLAH